MRFILTNKTLFAEFITSTGCYACHWLNSFLVVSATILCVVLVGWYVEKIAQEVSEPRAPSEGGRFEHGGEFGQPHHFVRKGCSGKVQIRGMAPPM